LRPVRSVLLDEAQGQGVPVHLVDGPDRGLALLRRGREVDLGRVLGRVGGVGPLARRPLGLALGHLPVGRERQGVPAGRDVHFLAASGILDRGPLTDQRGRRVLLAVLDNWGGSHYGQGDESGGHRGYLLGPSIIDDWPAVVNARSMCDEGI